MGRGTPMQRRILTDLNRLEYVDDDVLFNTIKMGLNKGYNEYLRRRNLEPSDLTEMEIVQHIIDCDPRAVVNDLENHYKDYYIDYMGISGSLKKSKRRKSKRRKSKRKQRRKSKRKQRKSKSKRR